MSTPSDFKNTYVVAIILTLFVGVGLGYQLHTVINPHSGSNNAKNNVTNAVQGDNASPKEFSKIFSHTGVVQSVGTDNITFTTLLQNTDASYTETTMKVAVDANTKLTKINLRDATQPEETITLDDIGVGNEIVAISDEDVFGQTSYTASQIKLHEF